ncbi:MAG: diguanylate cyclase, partial [Gammaproteobacteria bacterium]|nr:diguanylate cyclase [Gammaproteobacteria bacterium]
MKIRQRLLITFTGVAITVLIIFGSISYQIAGDSSINEQVNLLNIFTIKTATSLSKTLKTIEQKNIPAFLTRREMHIRYPGILLSEKNELIQTDTDEDQPSRQKVLEHIKRHGFQGNHKGYLNGAQDKILWALATVAGTPYKLLMLHNTANTDSFFKTVGIKLLVAGFIVIWLAIWGALILSAWVSNRLDKQNAMMIHHALHDHLTDMPNRYLLFDRLQQAIYYYRRENQPVTLLLLNLKHFKEINDTLGHRSGDSLLKQIGPRLEGIFWEPDTIARLDGDEFAVLLPKVGMSNLNIVIRKLMKAMELPFPIDELMIEAGITIGISIFPDTGEDPDALIRQADVALWEANRHGCEYMIYSPETDPYSVDQLTLMSDLKQAIQDNMLELYYQAKIDIRTRRIIGVESLLRWHHPERGFVSP